MFWNYAHISPVLVEVNLAGREREGEGLHTCTRNPSDLPSFLRGGSRGYDEDVDLMKTIEPLLSYHYGDEHSGGE